MEKNLLMLLLVLGLWDAVCKAVNRVVNVPNDLIEFSVQSITAGIDALGEVDYSFAP